jgi:S-adenosyl methyltransferase
VTEDSSPLGQRRPPAIDTSVPHSARTWNYWLGGKDNYPVDRAAGDQYREMFPGIVDIALQSRAFLARAVRYLAGEAGIRQFLDIGTGLPTVDNTHQVAQRVAPASRIVYVDNDPLVLAHAEALLTSTPEGVTTYLDADLREPEAIVKAAAGTLDFGKPIALMLMEILGHITDDAQARSIVRRLVDALPAGSHLVIADGTNVVPPEFRDAQGAYDETGADAYRLRNAEQITAFFEGTELLEPGVVTCLQWRPEVAPVGGTTEVEPLCGVGRKN